MTPGAAELEQITTRHGGLPLLLYEDESGAQRVVVLESNRGATIGRGEVAGVGLWGGPGVSLLHAQAIRLGTQWLIADDGVSRNGTFVNGERLNGRRRLRHGDAIRVGRTTLAFHDARAPRRDATTISDAPSAAGTITLLFTDL